MLANILISIVLILILGRATYVSYQDLKYNKCSCSGSCSKKKCSKNDRVTFT